MKMWLSGRRGRRGLLVVLAGLVLAAVLFYPVENWRGRRAWEEAKKDYAAHGEKLSRKDFVPSPIPDEQNRMAHPFMWRHFGVDGVRLGLSYPTFSKPYFMGLPSELTALQKLSRTNVNEIPFTELAKDLHPNEVVELIQFDETPLTDVLKTLFRQIDAKVEIDREQEQPFVDVNGREREVSIRLEHIAVAGAIEVILDNYELSVSRGASNQTFYVGAKQPSLEFIMGKLSSMDAVLAEFDEAMQRPQALMMNLRDLDEPSFGPGLWSARTLIECLTTRAQVRFLMGDKQGAVQDLHRMRQVIDVLGAMRPRHVTWLMIQVYHGGTYAELIEALLRENLLTGDDVVRVQTDLETLDFLPGLPEAMRVDRAGELEWLEKHGNGPEFIVKKAAEWRALNGSKVFMPTNSQSVLPAVQAYAKETVPNAAKRLYAWMGPRGWVSQNQVTLAQCWQWQLEGIEPDAHRIDVKRQNEVQARVEPVLEGPCTPYNYLAQSVAYVFSHGIQSLAKKQVRVDEAYVACALQRFRENEGHYPEALAQLVPRFASRIPVDMFDGKPLRYHREQDGYRLYSIGWNGVDDQGKCSLDSEGSFHWSMEEGDWVWGGVPKR